MLMPSSRSVCRGYTLIEVIAVVVLMGLLASVFAPALISTSEDATRRQLIAQLVELDMRARQLALRGSWCMLRWDERERAMVLVEDRNQPREVQRAAFPVGVTLELDAGQAGVELNAHGQSQHYGYRLYADSWSATVRFNGMSGWYEVRADAE